MSEMSTRDVIAGALEILADEENWTKQTEDHIYMDTDGEVIERSCLWGAFKRAVIPGFYLSGHSGEELQLVMKPVTGAAKLVGKVVREQYPDRMIPGFNKDWQSVVPFNDHSETVHSEVIAVLEKALANEQ